MKHKNNFSFSVLKYIFSSWCLLAEQHRAACHYIILCYATRGSVYLVCLFCVGRSERPECEIHLKGNYEARSAAIIPGICDQVCEGIILK